jgi:hypothetical protein
MARPGATTDYRNYTSTQQERTASLDRRPGPGRGVTALEAEPRLRVSRRYRPCDYA